MIGNYLKPKMSHLKLTNLLNDIVKRKNSAMPHIV